MINEKLALIAGEGILPEILAKRLFEKGILSLVLVLQGKTDRFNYPREIVFESSPGKINNISNILKKNNINKIIMIGKIDKRAFLERKGFDFKALLLLRKIKNGNDMSIFNIINKEFNKIGIEVLPQDKYLEDLIVKKGVITKKKPSKKEIQDAEFGICQAAGINGHWPGSCCKEQSHYCCRSSGGHKRNDQARRYTWENRLCSL
jgi:DUF1009 family protein